MMLRREDLVDVCRTGRYIVGNEVWGTWDACFVSVSIYNVKRHELWILG